MCNFYLKEKIYLNIFQDVMDHDTYYTYIHIKVSSDHMRNVWIFCPFIANA